jgi:hypothetical protein
MTLLSKSAKIGTEPFRFWQKIADSGSEMTPVSTRQ